MRNKILNTIGTSYVHLFLTKHYLLKYARVTYYYIVLIV